ncbi:MAG: YybH family protein [Burkholderiaceae bacterium]
MPKPKPHAAHISLSVDDVEAAFYEAFQKGDIEKLMACWADEDEIVCIHPGGSRAIGPLAVRASFEAVFAKGTVHAIPVRVRMVESLSSIIHSVVERIKLLTKDGPREAYVIATNVYFKTAQGWRMVAHHASPGTVQEAHEANDAPTVLH